MRPYPWWEREIASYGIIGNDNHSNNNNNDNNNNNLNINDAPVPVYSLEKNVIWSIQYEK